MGALGVSIPQCLNQAFVEAVHLVGLRDDSEVVDPREPVAVFRLLVLLQKAIGQLRAPLGN